MLIKNYTVHTAIMDTVLLLSFLWDVVACLWNPFCDSFYKLWVVYSSVVQLQLKGASKFEKI